MNDVYLDTARLLTQVAPFVFADDTFALKGGTAINLFIRDMPRLGSPQSAYRQRACHFVRMHRHPQRASNGTPPRRGRAVRVACGQRRHTLVH
jgi:hypothetical protein